MKVLTLVIAVILLTALSPNCLYSYSEDFPLGSDSSVMSGPSMIFSSPRMDGLTKEALKRAAKNQRELYEGLFPKPAKFGKGWLTPWQFPKPHNKYTKESFWQRPWTGESGQKMESASLLVEMSSEELDAYLKAMISEIKEKLPDDFLPSDISVDRFVLGTVLLGWRICNSGALNEQSLLFTSAMDEMAALNLEALKKKEEDSEDLDKKMSMVVLRKVMDPLKGMSTDQIKASLKSEVATVQEITAMTYLKCDDWKRLGTPEADASTVHVGTLAIGLVVTEPDASVGEKSDLLPENSSSLASRLNGHISNFKQAMIQILQIKTKRKIDKLEEALKNTQNDNGRHRIMKQIEELEKEEKAQTAAYGSLSMKVSYLDVGDNCYSVEMTGKGIDKVATPFPFSLNNIRLRNGNAVVSIGIGGNYPSQSLEGDLKNILRKMDGVSGFFRK